MEARGRRDGGEAAASVGRGGVATRAQGGARAARRPGGRHPARALRGERGARRRLLWILVCFFCLETGESWWRVRRDGGETGARWRRRRDEGGGDEGGESGEAGY